MVSRCIAFEKASPRHASDLFRIGNEKRPVAG
jgi:hypothetical protein